jgi:hypothetical protein
MALAPGTRVGTYEVATLLGAGGMGEVYRATDTNLKRQVALKVLPVTMAADAERLARFQREAEVLAALNHPHIAAIHGLEKSGGVTALVMELVEGEDLAQRIARGPVSLDEALPIARQIAEALEAAHEQGIVHRDLKPANIKVRPDGTVKVLDFGLAKALEPGGARPAGDLANSPTITSPAMTQAGMILGTAAYMAPEQARGRPVDKRADIWAFGCVLYEMLTGRRAFAGDDTTEVLSRVLQRDPDWTLLPGDLPAHVTTLLSRCLEKDPQRRVRDIGEARIALSAPQPHPATPASAARPAGLRRLLLWTTAAMGVIAAASAWFLNPVPAVPLRKMELLVPGDSQSLTLSPNGQSVAYFARGHVWVRDLGALGPRDIATASPGERNRIVWSPDSSLVGYNTADAKFWVVAAAGGTPLQICAIPETGQLMGAAWRADGSIVLAIWRGSLYQVPATGGEPRPMVTIVRGKEIDFHDPVLLPGGRVLVATHFEPKANGAADYVFEIIDGDRREPILAHDSFRPVAYLDGGYLLTARLDANQGLWAVPYQGSGALRIEDAFLVAAGAALDASADRRDTLLYSLAATGPQLRELVWVDRAGRVTGQIGSGIDLSGPALSPDGARVAFSARVDQTLDIWVRDVATGADLRGSFEAGDEQRPAWFPDGRRIAYLVPQGGTFASQLFARELGGASERRDLVAGLGGQFSRDGRYLAIFVDDRGPRRLRYATVGGNGELSPAVPLFKSSPEPDAVAPTFSPDGRLIAYAERQSSGNMEVFVTRFPSGEGRLQVSAGGGRAPVWAANGELFFLAGVTDGAKRMMAVRIDAGDPLRASVPLKLFDIGAELDANYPWPNFDVAADGKRLLMVRRTANTGPATHWVLVQNWRAEFPQVR